MAQTMTRATFIRLAAASAPALIMAACGGSAASSPPPASPNSPAPASPVASSPAAVSAAAKPATSAVAPGGDQPDLMMLGVIPNAADFLKTQCADLTPYLSGDAVKDYPNLANLPTLSWRSTVFNGGIFGVPPPRSAPSGIMYVNQTLLEKE